MSASALQPLHAMQGFRSAVRSRYVSLLAGIGIGARSSSASLMAEALGEDARSKISAFMRRAARVGTFLGAWANGGRKYEFDDPPFDRNDRPRGQGSGGRCFSSGESQPVLLMSSAGGPGVGRFSRWCKAATRSSEGRSVAQMTRVMRFVPSSCSTGPNATKHFRGLLFGSAR